MAEIRLVAMITYNGGPQMTTLSARLGQEDWPGGGTVPILLLNVGVDTVRIWPADAEHVRALGNKLVALAEELDRASPCYVKIP